MSSVSRLILACLPCLPLAAQDPPNILLVVADDWGHGHAGAYGCTWVKTPAFDRVAREGLLFTRAFTPNAKCSPSRACILTGRNPWQLGAAVNHVPFFPAAFTTYPEALVRLGWQVGMTGKGWAPGVAHDAAGKPRQMCGKPWQVRTQPSPATGISRTDYAANFADFLAAQPAGKPWCFWYGGQEPHREYEQGSGAAKGGKRIADIDRVPGCWPDDELVRHDLLDYAFEVEHFDRHLGRMLDALERRGELDRTLVIVTSDNGMPFPRAKGFAYAMSNRLPLAVRWPAGIAGRGLIIDDPVSFVDLAPTIMAAAGIPWERTGMAPAAGRPLQPIFAASRGGRVDATRTQVLIGRERNDVGRPGDAGYPMRGIVQGDLLLVKNYEPSRWPACNPESGYLDTDGSPTKTRILELRRTGAERRFWDLCFGMRGALELYDYIQDPDCLRNLADDAAHQARAAELTARMEAALKDEGDLRMVGRGAEYDALPYSGDDVRGFFERLGRGEKVRAGWVSPTDAEPAP